MYNDYYKMDNEHIVMIGYTDEITESPRETNDYNLGEFLTWLGMEESPDFNEYPDFDEFLAEFGIDFSEYDYDIDKVMEDLIDKADKKGYFLFPVYVYEHGETCYSLNPIIPCYVIGGFIYTDKESIFRETKLTNETKNLREKVKEILGCEVDEYSNWANGHVMEYMVYNLKDLEYEDSCGGFYGDEPSENGLYDTLGFTPTNNDYLGNYDCFEECIGNLITDGSLKISWQ